MNGESNQTRTQTAPHASRLPALDSPSSADLLRGGEEVTEMAHSFTRIIADVVDGRMVYAAYLWNMVRGVWVTVPLGEFETEADAEDACNGEMLVRAVS